MGKSIVLIGMPGTGKTTIGQDLSQKTGLEYIDTDDLVKAECKMALKNFVAINGTEAFLQIQRSVISGIKGEELAIATGGGVVLDEKTMEYLSILGKVIFLYTPFEVLEARLAPDRKLARKNGESFKDVFERRQPLYRRYSDYVIDCGGRDVDSITAEIEEYLDEERV